MNLIYIHQHFVTRDGYSGTRSYEFSRYLVKEGGHKVYMITGNNRKSNLRLRDDQRELEMDVEGISLHVLNIPYAQAMGFWARVKAFLSFSWKATIAGIRKESPDVVFATSTPITVAIPGLITAWIKRVPFVFEVRDIWPESAVATGALTNPVLIFLSRCFELLVYRFSSRIVVISDRMKVRLQRVGRVDPNKISVVHIGADLDLFGRNKESGFRVKNGLEDKFVAIFAGAHGRANGLELIIEASGWLPDKCRIVLIGEGGEKESLKAMSRRLKTDKVLFFDPVPKTQLAGILDEVDCCLMILKPLPLFETACPNKFFDYLATGKPILANFSGEIAALLEEHQAGLYVKKSTPESLAETIGFLSEHPELCATMGKNARHLAVHLDRSSMAKRFEELLKDVINRESLI